MTPRSSASPSSSRLRRCSPSSSLSREGARSSNRAGNEALRFKFSSLGATQVPPASIRPDLVASRVGDRLLPSGDHLPVPEGGEGERVRRASRSASTRASSSVPLRRRALRFSEGGLAEAVGAVELSLRGFGDPRRPRVGGCRPASSGPLIRKTCLSVFRASDPEEGEKRAALTSASRCALSAWRS